MIDKSVFMRSCFILLLGLCLCSHHAFSSSIISTVAGTGVASYSGDNSDATSAAINRPSGIDVDLNGNVYFCDSSNDRIRVIKTNGIIYTFLDSTDFNYPSGVAFNAEGKLYAQ